MAIRTHWFVMLVAALVSGAILAGPKTASAGIVAQLDFQSSFNAGTNTSITRNPGGTSSTAEVVGTGTVNINTGATGLGDLFVDEVRFGMLEVAGAGTTGGVRSINTSSNGQVQDYQGQGATLGQGAVFTVIRPHFDGIQAGRRTWVGHDIQQADQIWLFSNDNVDGPTLRLGASTQQGANLPNFVWDSSKWYVLGGSWMTAPNGPNVDISLNIYARVLGDPASSASFSSEFYSNESNGPLDDQFYIGTRDTIGDSADSDIALFRMYDTFFTQADFDQAVNSLMVPEPSTFTLSILALAGIARIRRRDKRNRR